MSGYAKDSRQPLQCTRGKKRGDIESGESRCASRYRGCEWLAVGSASALPSASADPARRRARAMASRQLVLETETVVKVAPQVGLEPTPPPHPITRFVAMLRRDVAVARDTRIRQRERRRATLRLTAGSDRFCRVLPHVAGSCWKEPISRGVKNLPLAGTSRELLGVAAHCGTQKARKRQCRSRSIGGGAHAHHAHRRAPSMIHPRPARASTRTAASAARSSRSSKLENCSSLTPARPAISRYDARCTAS